MCYMCEVEYYLGIEKHDACYKMDEPWKYYVKWNIPDTKSHVLHDSIYMKCPGYANL